MVCTLTRDNSETLIFSATQLFNFFQASLRNWINCIRCDNHFFISISFPQFIYDLFHISLTLFFSTAFQCWKNVVTIRNNVATMLQRCVRLKTVVANRFVNVTSVDSSTNKRVRNHSVIVKSPFASFPLLNVPPITETTNQWAYLDNSSCSLLVGNTGESLASSFNCMGSNSDMDRLMIGAFGADFSEEASPFLDLVDCLLIEKNPLPLSGAYGSSSSS